jgi:hypothetical protein
MLGSQLSDTACLILMHWIKMIQRVGPPTYPNLLLPPLFPIHLGSTQHVFYLNSSLSLVISSLTVISLISFTQSIHLFFDQPLPLHPFTFMFITLLVTRFSSFLITCPYQLKRLPFGFSVIGATQHTLVFFLVFFQFTWGQRSMSSASILLYHSLFHHSQPSHSYPVLHNQSICLGQSLPSILPRSCSSLFQSNDFLCPHHMFIPAQTIPVQFLRNWCYLTHSSLFLPAPFLIHLWAAQHVLSLHSPLFVISSLTAISLKSYLT